MAKLPVGKLARRAAHLGLSFEDANEWFEMWGEFRIELAETREKLADVAGLDLHFGNAAGVLAEVPDECDVRHGIAFSLTGCSGREPGPPRERRLHRATVVAFRCKRLVS